jgi:hypothetical protein
VGRNPFIAHSSCMLHINSTLLLPSYNSTFLLSVTSSLDYTTKFTNLVTTPLEAIVAMSTVITTAVRPNDAWLRIIIASLLNFVSFINATKALEPIFAPFRDSQGALGSTSSRTWSAREWRVIKIQVFGMGVALALAISQLASSETEPYFLVLECFACLATKLVANGLSLRRPRGKWQFLSTKTTDVLTEFPPFEHLPGPYKAPVSLFVAVLLGLWVLYFGFEQALPWFIASENNSRYMFIANNTRSGHRQHYRLRRVPYTPSKGMFHLTPAQIGGRH